MEKYILKDVFPFDIKKSLSCGQAFRWEEIEENRFIGVISGNVFEIYQKDENTLEVETEAKDSENLLREYLGLNYDYNLFNQLLIKNKVPNEVIEYSKGIRILNQDYFECLISYIISANNMVKRISKSVNLISQKFGKEIEFKGKKYYTFPTLLELSKATLEELRECGVGFRDKYIKETVDNILYKNIDLYEISKLDTETLRKKLINNKGVGRKVADCVMLYSYKRYEVFPIDVWIKRIMQKMFMSETEDISLNKMQEYAKNKFGNLAGLVNIYLFYYVRDNKIV